MTLKLKEPKALHFPVWLEAIIIAALLIMSVVEGMHSEIFFAVIFGLGGICFGLSLVSRLSGTDKNE